ncbi:F-box protein At5g49610-like isoform X2 [Diospyros lotus]|nr:F-box protein At5g49610-like isoform X2 [Diospyros lotus]
MLFEILHKLPIESILTCRAVCKTWKDHIRDPWFIEEVGNSCHQSMRLILKSLPGSHLTLLDIEGCRTRQIPIDEMLEVLQIMCTCDGLLCMASALNLDPVVIYNPITRERVILPSSSSSEQPISSHEVGIGFDPSSNKYKVVRAYTISEGRVKRFEIISLGERSWRRLNAPEGIVDCDGSGVVFYKDALYWTMNGGHSTLIVQFNLSHETFHMVSFPDYFPSDHASLGLIEVGGCLTLVENTGSVIKLWRLTTANATGDNPYFSLLDTYDMHVNWGRSSCEFVCALNQESYLLQVGFRNSRDRRQEYLTRYSPEEIQYSNLGIHGLPPSFKIVCFKPSLRPLPAASSVA